MIGGGGVGVEGQGVGAGVYSVGGGGTYHFASPDHVEYGMGMRGGMGMRAGMGVAPGHVEYARRSHHDLGGDHGSGGHQELAPYSNSSYFAPYPSYPSAPSAHRAGISHGPHNSDPMACGPYNAYPPTEVQADYQQRMIESFNHIGMGVGGVCMDIGMGIDMGPAGGVYMPPTHQHVAHSQQLGMRPTRLEPTPLAIALVDGGGKDGGGFLGNLQREEKNVLLLREESS